MSTAEEHGEALERLRILDEIEFTETEHRNAGDDETAHRTAAVLAELNAQLQELES